ncbi:MAG: potassium channel family protein [Cyclobacteriaceae bacterium]
MSTILSIISHIAGVVLVLLAISDFCLTAFIPNKEGWFTRRVSRIVYSIMFSLAGKDGCAPILNYMGFAIIFSLSLFWIVCTWTGFTFIFLSDPGSVIHGNKGYSADLWEIIYFVGFSLSTSGLGDFVASNDAWRIVTALSSVVGIMLITMSITYLVPVISNMIQKRKLSITIASLGESPEKIVLENYNGEDFSAITDHLTNISEMLFEYSRNHLAYPILHYMHDNNKNTNVVLKMSSLDEALNIFLYHLPKDKCPQGLNLKMVRRSLTEYLTTLKFTDPASEDPERPRLGEIEEGLGVKLRNTSKEDMDKIYSGLSERRRLWLANIHSNGFKWEHIRGNIFDEQLDHYE